MVLNGADRDHAERLLLAMVPIDEVIDGFRCLTKISRDSQTMCGSATESIPA
jgi:hypothetical protein